MRGVKEVICENPGTEEGAYSTNYQPPLVHSPDTHKPIHTLTILQPSSHMTMITLIATSLYRV